MAEVPAPITEKHEKNSVVTLKNVTPMFNIADTTSDYNFLGWNRDIFAVSPEYYGEGLPRTAQFDRDVDLYGIWTLKYCWLTYNTMGGTGDSYSIKVLKGSLLGELPTTSKEGYIFLGWYTAPVGGVVVSAGTPIMNDTILFAQWQIDYNIFLDNMEGMINAAIDELDLGSLITIDGEGGEGGGEVKPPLAPLWMADNGYYTWTTETKEFKSGTWELCSAGDSAELKKGKYEQNTYPSGMNMFYVDTIWCTPASGGAGTVCWTDTAHGNEQKQCTTHGGFTEVRAGDLYRILHFDGFDHELGQTYDKFYRKVKIIPGKDMTPGNDQSYTYSETSYQYPGHKLIRWYATINGRHDDGTRGYEGQSLELSKKGVKDLATALYANGHKNGEPSFLGEQILGATSIIYPGGDGKVWLNVTDFASVTSRGDHGFYFWADRYPIP